MCIPLLDELTLETKLEILTRSKRQYPCSQDPDDSEVVLSLDQNNLYIIVNVSHFNMYTLVHDPSVCVFMCGQATESRWVIIMMFDLFISDSR